MNCKLRRKTLTLRRIVAYLLFTSLFYLAAFNRIRPMVSDAQKRYERVTENISEQEAGGGGGELALRDAQQDGLTREEKARFVEFKTVGLEEEGKNVHPEVDAESGDAVIDTKDYEREKEGDEERDGVGMKIEFPDDQNENDDENENYPNIQKNERKEDDGILLINSDSLDTEQNERENDNNQNVNSVPVDEKAVAMEEEEMVAWNLASRMERELSESKAEEERVAQAVYNDIHGNVKDYLDEKSKEKLNDARGTFPHNVLLLASMGRSGSSFLGGLLNSQKQVLYIFEPFHDVEQQRFLTTQYAIDGLKGLFTCNVPSRIAAFFRTSPKFYIKQYYKDCGLKKSCLTPETIQRNCQRKEVIVVKTIRTRVSWLQDILNDDNVNMKVIHLVRDPRPSLISGWKRGWTVSEIKQCQGLNDDIETGDSFSAKYPDKYMSVRYEDLCEDPWGLARNIFTFLGYTSLPESTVRFLKSSTSGKADDGGGAYSIKRNTKRMQQKWRSEISEAHLLKIESACAQPITRLGFHLFGNVTAARNYSLPLFDERYTNRLFRYVDD